MVARILQFKKFFRQKSNEDLGLKRKNFLNAMPRNSLEEILLFSEADTMLSTFGDLQLKNVLFFNDQRHKFLFKKLLAKESKSVLNYIYSGEDIDGQNPGYYTLYGGLNRFPIKPLSCDTLILPISILSQPLDIRSINSISQLVKNGGRVIVSFMHPTLEHILYKQNPAETGSPDNTISGYYTMFKNNHLYLEDMQEGCVNQTLKPFFTVDGEFDHYHDYKGTPLVVSFRLVKFVKK